MSGVLKIDIAETAEELKAVLEQQQRSSQRRKVQVLWWLKTGQANLSNSAIFVLSVNCAGSTTVW
ncbi:hypothetical protein [Leptolyngbya sp. O-77]|uniref:hypothetical protein n=1 Tax=Leptolyngbya sp. O-77 TaxID=1080068 RepID=UPI0012E37D6E|nr:hypothetical protein [Leptolyngbya sp. O-77]